MNELQERYFIDFLIWCADGPEEKTVSEMIFWVDHKYTSMDNFWEWIVKYKIDEVKRDAA